LKDFPTIIVESMVLVGAIMVVMGLSLGLTNYLIDEQIPMRMFEWIHRFIEIHSHPRYESGVQDFDMTILGETPDILNDLLELVEHEDKKHYRFIGRKCYNKLTPPTTQKRDIH